MIYRPDRGSIAEHQPVLLAEVIQLLGLRPGDAAVDGTVGLGGHARAILEATAPDGHLLAIDRDGESLAEARRRLADLADRIEFVQGSYADLRQHLARHHLSAPLAVLVDLGLSSWQLAQSGRGFSFQDDGPLDMRFDRGGGTTAAEIVNAWPEADLAELLRDYGEEPNARRIAAAIAWARRNAPLTTVPMLVNAISSATRRRPGQRLHPATRTFQALRIAVNGELAELNRFLPEAVAALAPGGRLGVISFHSLEDRMVKRFAQAASRDCVCPPSFPVCRCDHQASVKLITKKPVIPSRSEQSANPRARSAKLRVVERLIKN